MKRPERNEMASLHYGGEGVLIRPPHQGVDDAIEVETQVTVKFMLNN